jgi:para-aminobenzoate synthetase component 1
MNKELAIQTMNNFGSKKKPFVFIVDYEMKHCIVCEYKKAAANKIFFNFKGLGNYNTEKSNVHLPVINHIDKVDFNVYSKAFDFVQENLKKGNSYLVNLTFETPVETSISLERIFHATNAAYKLLYRDEFVVFSPESFIQIKGDEIYTFPMKGTIDASVAGARQLLIDNLKEQAEHATIVDLLRNDLSRHAKNVRVEKFRYIETIHAQNRELLQVSSQIKGELGADFNTKLGNIIFDMLPAGSVTGAPKHKTLEIIAKAENYKRGYYTGIAGYFDGENLDSCVLIRFIEKIRNGQLVYKSGGGITSQSEVNEEYDELNSKIYVPIA